VRHALSPFSGALLLLVCSRICTGGEIQVAPAGRHVELIIGGRTAEAALLEASIRDMLTAKRLAVVATRKETVTAQDVAAAIAPPEEATPSLARALFDFTGSDEATLFLIDPRRGRVYVRRMALSHGLDAVARAGVRFVVEQSIDAILGGREIGVSREEFQRSVLPPRPVAEAPHPPPPPLPEPAPARPQWQLAVGYEVLAMGSGEYQQGAKFLAAARFTRVQIGVTARLAAPLSVTGDGAQARLWTAGAGLSAAAQLLTVGALSATAGLNAGFDMTHVEPAVTMPGLQAASAFWAPSPSVEPFAALEYLFGKISVTVAFGAELHPLAERYTVERGSAAHDVFVPWRVRPAATVLVGTVF
jgi:hypothetical protein